MKKRYVLLIILSLLFVKNVNAASVSIGLSDTTITKGSRVTIYVNINSAASWQLTGNGNGATSGCSLGDQGTGYSQNGENTNKTLTVTCYSTDVGNIGFVVTGVIGYMDNGVMKKMNISQGRTISVVKPRDPDANNYLSSLSVEGYELTPAFDKDTLEYSVSVPSNVDKVTVSATKASTYASNPTGVGEIPVTEGSNNLEVTVKSETGVNRTYKINVNVEDKNPISIKIDNDSYTLMKNLKDIKGPDGFKQENIKINEIEIPAFTSETLNITLVGIKDEKGNKMLATYDKEDKTYQLFNQNKSKQINLFILSPQEILEDFHKSKITINGREYDCLKLNDDENYIVIYAKDLAKGDNGYYIYDVDTESYIKYKDNMQKSYKEIIEKYKTAVLAFGIASGVLAFIVLILLLARTKKKKALKKEEAKVTIPEETKEVKKKVKEKTKANTKTEAIETIKDAQEIIEEYEKTMAIPKEEVKEETAMYDILNDDKKTKRKKRSR